jgi:sulfatase maturation enzyme AslB (radical SAM superfamily)
MESTLLWGKYHLFERDGEGVILDPVNLESIYLSREELRELEHAPGIDRSLLLQTLEEWGFDAKPHPLNARERLLQRLDTIDYLPMPKKIVGLRVLLTDKCNMGCSYCFVDTNSGKADLTEEELYEGLELLFEHNKGEKEVRIQWFGGEPTIRFDLMVLGDKYCDKLSKKYGVEFVRRTVVTNGVKLTEEMIAHLRKYRYGVGISLDGPTPINSLGRLLLNNKPADDKIHRTIERLKQESRISIGINLTPTPDNVATIPEAVQYFIDTVGVPFVYVNFPIPVDGRWQLSGRTLAESLYKARFFALSRGGMLLSGLDRIYHGLDSRKPRVFDHLEDDIGLNGVLMPGRRIGLCDINFNDESVIFSIDDIRADPALLGRAAKTIAPSQRCLGCPAIAICGGPSRNDVRLAGTTEPDPELCAFCERALELALWDNTGLQ